MTVERIGAGRYRVVDEGRSETVYVAGPPGRRWAYWNGQIFREETLAPPPGAGRAVRSGGVQQITAPMPATVLKVLAAPGARVTRGDTLLIVEAMKMELPLRASDDAVVVAVHCREGEIVQPDAVLVELE